MPIDKSWISKPQNTPEYENGLRIFLDFAFKHGSVDGRVIKCPCPICGFKRWKERGVVEEHLTCKPFPKNYKFWYMHGEESTATVPQCFQNTNFTEDTLLPQNLMTTMINDAFGFTRNDVNEPDVSCEPINSEETFNEGHIEGNNEDYAKFFELIEDGKQPLYEGCEKYSKLSFLIKLYHIKCLCRMTDKAMSMILELLKDAFQDAKIPVSFYEAKKTINKLGLNYTKIHACPNDCMLYFGEDEGLQECKRCKTSRWKNNKKKQPAKILRYFPLKPRLQRLFANYRLKEETQALCKKNQQSRQQQKIPHTSGAKSLARIRAEMENMGKEVDRGKVWIETHRRKDGNYVNDAAREVGERIEEIRSQRSEGLTEISPHDALGVVFGPEHPGRVRGLGMGVVPTVAFNKTSRRGGRFYMGSSNASAPPPQWQQEMADMRSQLNALTNLYRMNIGNIPEEFNHLFPTPPQQAQDSGSARSPVGPRRFSDRSNYGDRASGN